MVETLITTGSSTGNLTAGAGLAGLRDGTLSKTRAQSSQSVPSQPHYAGETTAAKTAVRAKLYGPSDAGIYTNAGNLTLTVEVSNDAFATAPTVVKTQTFSGQGNGAGQSFDMTGLTPVSATSRRIKIEHSSNDSSCYVAQVQFYEDSEGGGDPPPPPPPPPGTVRPFLILMADGQSNMVGAASPPAQTVYANRDRIFNFALDGTIKAAVEPLMSTSGSQWAAFNNISLGSSPIMSMANALLDRVENFDILICVSAKGATSHYDWAKGGGLYSAMVSREAACIAAALAARPGSFVLCKVMYQAESSTDSTTSATSWKTTLPTRVADRRADLGMPDLFVLIPGLGQDPTGANATNAPAWPQLRLDQMTMDLPAGVFYVGVSDLPSNYGGVAGADVMNTDSVVEFGKRWAAGLWNRLPDYARRML